MQNGLRKLAANGIFEVAIKILNALSCASRVFLRGICISWVDGYISRKLGVAADRYDVKF